MYARRDLLKFGLASGAVGAAALPVNSLAQDLIGDLIDKVAHQPAAAPAAPAVIRPVAAIAPLPPRSVALHNLHTDERLEAVYFDKGAYVPDALSAVNHVLRDFRTGDVHTIDPNLLDLLHTLQGSVDSNQPFQIISGYRSPKTNAMLHETTPGVANNSFHMKGMAIDIRLPDVVLAHLHNAALSLGRGGVGYYPVSDFVHVDVGPVRRWG